MWALSSRLPWLELSPASLAMCQNLGQNICLNYVLTDKKLPGVTVKKKKYLDTKAYTMSSINASDFFLIQVLLFFQTFIIKLRTEKNLTFLNPGLI